MSRRQSLLLLLLSALALSSCTIVNSSASSSEEPSSEALVSSQSSEEPEPSSESSGEPEPSSEPSSESESSSASTSEPTPSSDPVSSSSQISSETSSDLSSESSAESSSQSSGGGKQYVDADYDFYCVNDFHGSVLERESNYYESGIAKYFGKLRELKEKDPDHTFVFSSGDMFQGSLESNANLGSLVIDAMNDLPFDAMEIGNHEFDYGQEALKANIDKMDFPVLGGNIMSYKNGEATDEPWYEPIVPSTIIERGGNKIGVVGMIGEGQTSSIASQHVADIDFVSPEEPAKKEAENLRKAGCDIVILLIHDTYKNAVFAADKTYFDGVFTGHTHQKEDRLINNVPFVQSYCNGEAISHFKLNITSGVVTCTQHNILNASYYWNEDEAISKIRDFYLDESFAEMAGRSAGTVNNGSLTAKIGVPNLSCIATYEKYKAEWPELTLAMTNSQRAPLSGEIDYSDIYKATPFMNATVIASVLGSDILAEAKWNNHYVGEPERYPSIEEDRFYTIACTDYVLFHQDREKKYDYFSSLNEGRGGQVKEIYYEYPPDIFFDYCVNTLHGQIDASAFLNTSPGFHLFG